MAGGARDASGTYLWGIGFGTDTNGLGNQAAPRPGASDDNPVTYPFLSFDGRVTIRQSQWGNRSWDFNLTGAAHYGLFVDWIEDLRHVGGQEIVDDLARGAEATCRCGSARPSDRPTVNVKSWRILLAERLREPDASKTPGLATALQDQLGVKLEGGRGAVEVRVIGCAPRRRDRLPRRSDQKSTSFADPLRSMTL